MKVQVRIRVDEHKNKTATSYYYATITAEGETRAVDNFMQFLRDHWDIDHRD